MLDLARLRRSQSIELFRSQIAEIASPIRIAFNRRFVAVEALGRSVLLEQVILAEGNRVPACIFCLQQCPVWVKSSYLKALPIEALAHRISVGKALIIE